MNGYFVRQEILDLLDKRQYLMDELKKPENFGDYEMEEDIQAIEDTLESIDLEIGDLAESLAGDIRNNEMEAKAYSEEADVLKAKQISAERRAKSEKDLLKYILKQREQRRQAPDRVQCQLTGRTPQQVPERNDQLQGERSGDP